MKANKFVALILFVTLMLTMFAGCGEKSDNDEKEDTPKSTVTDTITDDNNDNTDVYEEENSTGISKGRINGNVYKNSFADITFTKPSDWEFKFINTPSSSAQFDKEIRESGAVVDMELESPNGTSLQVNFEDPSITILEDVEDVTEEWYLNELKNAFSYLQFGEIYEVKIGENTYKVLDAEYSSGEVQLFQRYYFCKIDQYMVEILITSKNESEMSAITNMFS